MRVGEHRAAEGDEVLVAALEERFCLIRSPDDTDAGDRDRDGFLDRFGQVRPPAGLETHGLDKRVEGLIGAAGDVDEVRAGLFDLLRHLDAFRQLDAAVLIAEQIVELVDRQTDRDREVLAALFFDALQDVQKEAHAVVEAAAVHVLAVIGVGGQELLDEIAVGRVEFDAVAAGFLDAFGCRDELLLETMDLGNGQGACRLPFDDRGTETRRDVAGADDRRHEFHHLHDARVFEHGRVDVFAHAIGDVPEMRDDLADLGQQVPGIGQRGQVLSARVVQLDKDLRAVGVDLVHHLRERLDHVVAGHRELASQCQTVVVVDTGDFRDDEADAAFGPLLIVV